MLSLVRKLFARNGWRRLTGPIPAKPLQKFDVRLKGGDELHGLVIGVCITGKSLKDNSFSVAAVADMDHVHQGVGFFVACVPITHYRLHVPMSDAEMATRAERENLWRTWADDADADAIGEDVDQPEEVS